MLASGLSEIGKLRNQNEDSLFVSAKPFGALPNLFVVADGMGGHNAGDVASRLAVEQFCGYIKENTAESADLLDLCVSAANHANQRIRMESASNRGLSGMGTTFSACFILDNRLQFIHIGDSRIYMVTPGQITQLTNDHTFVSEMVKAGHITQEEARAHPRRNVLLRVMCGDENLEIDACTRNLEGSCAVLLCSDGLNGMITDDVIMGIINQKCPVDERVRMLIDAANAAGGNDNISAILIEI
jgi:protein phosphatase